MKFPPSLLLLPLAALSGFGCVDRQRQADAKKSEAFTSDPTIAVATVTPTVGVIRETVDVTGDVVTGEEVSVSPKLGGRLTAVYVKEGDRVAQGQVIALVDTASIEAQIAQAEAGVAQARSGLSQAINNAALRPSQTSAAVATARQQANAALAGLRNARAQLTKVRTGARPEERRQAQAQVASAQSNLETQRKQLDRVRRLVGEGALAGQQLDIQQAQFDAAQAAYRNAAETLRLIDKGARSEDLEAARQGVAQAEAQYRAALAGVRNAEAAKRLDVTLSDGVDAARAQVRQAEASVRLARQSLQDARVVSPFSGTIEGRPLQVGTVVSPGVAVAKIIGQGGGYFEGDVPDLLIDKIQPGQPVEVIISPSNRAYPGVVRSISPSGDRSSRQFTARIEIQGARNLRPGLFARGRIVLRQVSAAVTVPDAAIVKDGEGSAVYVVQSGKAKKIRVELGLKEKDRREVTGLDPSAQVIVKGQTAVNDGSPVQIERPGGATGNATAGRPAPSGGN